MGLFFIFIFSVPSPAGYSEEQKLYQHLEKVPLSDSRTFSREYAAFIKKFPQSKLIPDVRLLAAEREKDIDLALEKYRVTVKYYPCYSRGDYAQYRICQILDLKSRWKELEAETSRAIKLFPSGKYAMEFRFMRASSLLMFEDFKACREECISITEKSHDFEILSRATCLMAEAERKTSGNSKSYISVLRTLVMGFRESRLFPSILYSLGYYYQQKKEYNRAYSAYSDIIKEYPDSPEADLAIAQIESMKKKEPVYVQYLPDSSTIDQADTIDIQPEIEAENRCGRIWYSVSIGPFTKRRDAEKIIRLLEGYDNSEVIKTGAGYTLFIGRFADTDGALATRIRLAEEFGINGNIVRFSENKSKSYIYRD